MSAAVSQENQSNEADLNGLGKNENTGQVTWIKKWTALLGLFTTQPAESGVTGSTAQARWAMRPLVNGAFIKTVLSILTGLVTLYSSIMMLSPAHEMMVSAGKDLTISYHPQQNLVKAVFNVRASEFGSKLNQILSATAWLEQPPTSKVLLHISSPVFEENELRTYLPVIPNGAQPKNMQCSICIRLTDSSREVFQSVGLRRLIVEFKDRASHNHRVSFCFSIGDDQLLSSQEKQFQYISEDVMCPDEML